ncbi:ABC-2 type transporter [Methanohalobium evestigatum Z-7303]|uniref:ABC-2 type transporter n=1 Tax=Methanohalobium evestigatum (strain ATCC BAA-1072 / DSM 3721 / NBRC 107634 / OCM 161 / Z-7303) TaxID=644295 RepID=D7E7I9_METEZ|nr:ABC transporter permease [Methanohalobium evestigatum]ADI74062.1 ABC-2 type transporter [Methanohalobium evestigatum Z-7303]
MIESIRIMWIRQIKEYWRSKPRLIASIVQPTIFLMALGFGLGPVFKQAGGLDYVQFLTPGILGMAILFGSVFNGVSLLWDKQFGFLKETLVAPVPRITLLIGRSIGGATTAVFQGIVLLAVSYFIGFRMDSLLHIPLVILFMFLIAFLFSLLGISMGAKLDDPEAFPLIINLVIIPIFFLSGALFPINNLPSTVTTIAKLNPLSYGVDGLRGTMIGSSDFGIATDVGILLVVTFVLLIISSYLFERLET